MTSNFYILLVLTLNIVDHAYNMNTTIKSYLQATDITNVKQTIMFASWKLYSHKLPTYTFTQLNIKMWQAPIMISVDVNAASWLANIPGGFQNHIIKGNIASGMLIIIDTFFTITNFNSNTEIIFQRLWSKWVFSMKKLPIFKHATSNIW